MKFSTLVLAFCLFLSIFNSCFGQQKGNDVYFLLEEGKERCFIEDVPKDTLVVAAYKVEYGLNGGMVPTGTPLTIKSKVTDNEGKLVLQREMTAENRVAFTSQSSGEHKICFSTTSTRWFGKQNLKFFLDVEVGESATNYEEIAKQEHLSALELSVRRLSDRVKDIRAEQNYQRTREGSFRNTSESTNSRVMWWSVIQTLILIGTGFWQITHLKNFFKAKKLV